MTSQEIKRAYWQAVADIAKRQLEGEPHLGDSAGGQEITDIEVLPPNADGIVLMKVKVYDDLSENDTDVTHTLVPIDAIDLMNRVGLSTLVGYELAEKGLFEKK